MRVYTCQYCGNEIDAARVETTVQGTAGPVVLFRTPFCCGSEMMRPTETDD